MASRDPKSLAPKEMSIIEELMTGFHKIINFCSVTYSATNRIKIEATCSEKILANHIFGKGQNISRNLKSKQKKIKN